MATTTATAASLTLTRPSRTGGPVHQVGVDAETLTPESCTCQAGQRGVVCHAVLSVATGPALLALARERWAQSRGLDELTASARVYGRVVRNRRKAQAEIERCRARTASCRYVVTLKGEHYLRESEPASAPGPSLAETDAHFWARFQDVA